MARLLLSMQKYNIPLAIASNETDFIMWIVNIALRRPHTFIVAAILILLAMPFVLQKMPTDIFPQINIPVVAELWEYRGLTAKEMSERVTAQAEREPGQAVDNIEHTESFSAAGLGIVKVFFQPGTDINTALTQTTMSANGAALKAAAKHEDFHL